MNKIVELDNIKAKVQRMDMDNSTVPPNFAGLDINKRVDPLEAQAKFE